MTPELLVRSQDDRALAAETLFAATQALKTALIQLKRAADGFDDVAWLLDGLPAVPVVEGAALDAPRLQLLDLLQTARSLKAWLDQASAQEVPA